MPGQRLPMRQVREVLRLHHACGHSGHQIAAAVGVSRYEPGLNRTYQDMAAHYGTAVLPARVRRPRDKAKVEVAVPPPTAPPSAAPQSDRQVAIVQRWILARLRHRRFHSLAELNGAIGELVEDLNAKPMRRLGTSRRALFERLERDALLPLPAEPYAYAEWRRCRAGLDYHAEWTPTRLLREAEAIGPATTALVERILTAKPHPEQGFRACLGILRLVRGYGAERVEAACQRGLDIGARSYGSITSILRNGLDRAYRPQPVPDSPPVRHANIRGGGYYH